MQSILASKGTQFGFKYGFVEVVWGYHRELLDTVQCRDTRPTVLLPCMNDQLHALIEEKTSDDGE